MKQIMKIAGVCLVASALMWAAPPQCKSGSLTDYISLGANGCVFGGIVFANFKYSASAKGGAPVIKADQIKVDPTEIPTQTASLKFSAPWSVKSAESQGSTINYTASLPSGDTVPAALALALGAAQVGSIGSVTVDESTNVGKLEVYDRCTELTCQNSANDSFQFTPVSVVLMKSHVSLIGGLGGASLDEFYAQLNLCAPCV